MMQSSDTHLSEACNLRNRIRRIITEQAGIELPIEEVRDSTDLYRAGMNSYASVLLMISLENEFGVEFPDGMLSRSVFESIDSIANALESLKVEQ